VPEVDAAPSGDAHFPEIDPGLWRESERARAAQSGDCETAPGFSFVTFERKSH